MKTKFTFLSLLFLCIATNITAQYISGNVICDQNEPVEFANIALFSLPDSTLITGAVTNENGHFSLNANGSANNAFLQISFIGYETQTVSAAQNQTVVLKTDALVLGEVLVQGSLPQIRLRNDAIVTTVQNSVLSQAGTGNDVLKRLPALTGDNGSFSVLGKGEAIVYINNRLMRDPSELDNLNSADIREVEIVTNPGARYDASVKAVIRIITVRKVGDGFSFDMRSSVFQSSKTDLTEQLNVNYRKNGWDIFGTAFYSQGVWFQRSDLWQKAYVDTLWRQENKTSFDDRWSTIRGIAGINYEISPKHYTGIRYTLTANPINRANGELGSIVFANDEFYDKFGSILEEIGKSRPTHRINAYYNGEFGELKVDFNADYFSNEQSRNTRTTETSQEFDDRIVTSKNNVSNRLIASKIIVSYPILGGQFSLGSEYTNTHRKDNFQNEERIVASTNTAVNEQNNSFFTEYSRAIPNIGQLGVGLRYENVRSEYLVNDLRSDEQSRNYHQWFPNISFSTQLKDIGLQLSYTAKTQRPSYRELRSNVTYANRFTLETGNPFLKPTIVHDVTLTSTWKFLQLMLSYKNEHNAIMFWTERMEDNPAISILTLRNFDRLPGLTAFVSAAPKFGIWLPQASVGMIKQWMTMPFLGDEITLNKPMFTASLNNSFSLPKGFLLTFDTRFQGKGDYQNVYLKENQIVVGAGITKAFLNEQLRVELKGHDILGTQKQHNLLRTSQMEIYQNARHNTQRVELTVRYRFNSARSKYRGTGAGESQINRL
ncbi:MAG: outer membrane beta-barrel protein [Dysgonamonadaceae bacterium]|jgi:hypothetical protein|nr:outer membrane beta-barrel protein [Dysgonamonadaceae bacterium]